MSRTYASLDNYSVTTLTRENRQDRSMSKCMGGLCAMKPEKQPEEQSEEQPASVEQYGGFSLRAAIRPPYNQCWGSEGGHCPKKNYPAVR